MRIVVSAILYGRGGTETHLWHLSKILVERGHEVIFACRYANRSVPLIEMQKQLGITCLSTPFDQDIRKYRWSTMVAFILWSFFLLKKPSDLIITLENTRFLEFLAMFQKKKSFIFSLRAGLPVAPTDYIHASVLAKLSGVLVETPMQAQAFEIAHPNIPVKAIPLLGNINPHIPRRNKRVTPQGKICIAFLGRYNKKKGIYRLLEIWSKLNLTDLQLEFYGHGNEKEELQASIIQKGLEDSVTVHDGWTNPAELTEIMGEIDLLVLPSEEEGLPIVLMEAMAHGVPFIATDVGAVQTFSQDNPDVLVVPLDNEQIATAIVKMIQNIRNEITDGERLQKYYQDRYAYNKLIEAWINAIENPGSWTK